MVASPVTVMSRHFVAYPDWAVLLVNVATRRA
jgi:hypothetical protein